MLSGDGDVGSLAFYSAEGLMDHHFGVRQDKALALFTGRQNNSCAGRSQAHAESRGGGSFALRFPGAGVARAVLPGAADAAGSGGVVAEVAGAVPPDDAREPGRLPGRSGPG